MAQELRSASLVTRVVVGCKGVAQEESLRYIPPPPNGYPTTKVANYDTCRCTGP